MKNENKLIADFMGIGHLYPGNTPIDKLQYHTSWEWLMSVVEKIESLKMNNGDWFMVSIGTFKSLIMKKDKLGNPIFKDEISFELMDKKQSTHQAVVEFIRWYNENK